jgi:hypothetical protein
MNDIIYLENGIEIIPIWKQCGERNSDWSKDEKWLWDTGDWTQHMLYVNKKDGHNAWWVWEKYERGHVIKEKDGSYTAHIHIDMGRSDKKGFKTLEEASRRVAIPKHHIKPGEKCVRIVYGE